MERASPYPRKVGVVLSGTMSPEIMSDTRKASHAKDRGKVVN